MAVALFLCVKTGKFGSGYTLSEKRELLLEDANNEEYLIRRMRCHTARGSRQWVEEMEKLLDEIFLKSR